MNSQFKLTNNTTPGQVSNYNIITYTINKNYTLFN